MPRVNPDMPVINPAEVQAIEVKHRMEELGNRFECSLYYIAADFVELSTLDLKAFGELFWNQIKNNWAAMTESFIDTTHILVSDMHSLVTAPGIHLVDDTDPKKSGLVAATPRMPMFMSQAFTRRTQTPGQKGRGQCRYPGLYEDAVVGDTFTAPHVALQTAFVSDLATPIPQLVGAVNLTWLPALCGVHMESGIRRVRGEPVLSWSLPTYVGTQNSRKRGRGQ